MKKTFDNSQNIPEEIAIYESEDGDISFNVNVFSEDVWLTQKQMAELFAKDRKTITEHINNIYKEGEWQKRSTCWDFQLVQKEGKRTVSRYVEHYNLDIIISVGYRVKSTRGTQFRKWANRVIKRYLTNGYVVDEVRIKQIESSISQLVSLEKIRSKEVSEIKELLKHLISRPIIIQNNNNVSMGSRELETKIIELLDKIIIHLTNSKAEKSKLQQIKQDLSVKDQDRKTKNRIVKFFKEIGDDKSEIYKVIRGAGIAKNIISELVKLGNKLW